jgi:hypothetical protein
MHTPQKMALAAAAVVLFAALLAGPERTREFLLSAPRVPAQWQTLLADVRAFEQRIGFRATSNFDPRTGAKDGYTMCGHAPRLALPYSYQDPLIRWRDATTARACRDGAQDDDVYFVQVEAVGEVGAAVARSMLEGKLDRFLYLIIHEDCHDQFDFPYGFEEALCNVLAYRGMAAFAREHYGAWTRERQALRTYAVTQAQLTHTVVQYYAQVEALYARHARGDMATAAALLQRARVFGAAERSLGWHRRTLNNVGLANEMTYSRHYPLLERVVDALDGDLTRSVAFFKRADRSKPAPAAVMQVLRVADTKSLPFVRAYEAAVAAGVAQALADETGMAARRRIK